jgi:hypothetical protein
VPQLGRDSFVADKRPPPLPLSSALSIKRPEHYQAVHDQAVQDQGEPRKTVSRKTGHRVRGEITEFEKIISAWVTHRNFYTTNASASVPQIIKLSDLAESTAAFLSNRSKLNDCSSPQLCALAKVVASIGQINPDVLLNLIANEIAFRLEAPTLNDQSNLVPNADIGRLMLCFAKVNLLHEPLFRAAKKCIRVRLENSTVSGDDLARAIWPVAVLCPEERLDEFLPALPHQAAQLGVSDPKNLIRLYQAHLLFYPLDYDAIRQQCRKKAEEVNIATLPERLVKQAIRDEQQKERALPRSFVKELNGHLEKLRLAAQGVKMNRFESEVNSLLEEIFSPLPASTPPDSSPKKRVHPQCLRFGFRWDFLVSTNITLDVDASADRQHIEARRVMILIELDGGTHFIEFNAGNRRMGKDTFQTRLAERYGLPVVRITYQEWSGIGTTKEQKIAFLKKRINQTLNDMRSHPPYSNQF